MKIDSYSHLAPAMRAKKSKKSSAASEGQFSGLLDALSEKEGADMSQDVAPVSSPASLLVVQEVSSWDRRDQEAVQNAGLTLDILEEIKIGLLLGEVPIERLQHIYQQMKKQRAVVQNPRLLEVMREIETRAAVELAKYETI